MPDKNGWPTDAEIERERVRKAAAEADALARAACLPLMQDGAKLCRTLDRAAIENLDAIHDPFFTAHESLFKQSQD